MKKKKNKNGKCKFLIKNYSQCNGYRYSKRKRKTKSETETINNSSTSPRMNDRDGKCSQFEKQELNHCYEKEI